MAPKQKGQELRATLQNMSATGVLLSVPTHFDIGEKIEYLITLPGDPKQGVGVRLHCMGRVVRHASEIVHPEGEVIGATIEWYQFVRDGQPLAVR